MNRTTFDRLSAIGALCLIISILLHLATFLANDWNGVFLGLQITLIVSAVPLIFAMVSSEVRNHPQGQYWQSFRFMPQRIRIFVAALLIYAIFNTMSCYVLSRGGTPQMQNGQYYLAIGSRLEPITEAEFLRQKLYQTRILTGYIAFFLVLSICYFRYPMPIEKKNEFRVGN